jgi:hypothetical protein
MAVVNAVQLVPVAAGSARQARVCVRSVYCIAAAIFYVSLRPQSVARRSTSSTNGSSSSGSPEKVGADRLRRAGIVVAGAGAAMTRCRRNGWWWWLRGEGMWRWGERWCRRRQWARRSRNRRGGESRVVEGGVGCEVESERPKYGLRSMATAFASCYAIKLVLKRRDA